MQIEKYIFKINFYDFKHKIVDKGMPVQLFYIKRTHLAL